jgi:phosphatidylglycerol---prolipoprotein diacylglyceryl transferase
MRQVLFWIPVPNRWFPDGFPVYGFGLMLFLTFITCTLWASWRAKKEGVNPQHIQDLAVWIFVFGIVGARIVYMIQYGVPLWQFFEIWKGGLVFYGSAIGGVAGYALAYWFVIRKHHLMTRQLADIIAPTVAWGLMIGRIGCLLNGCCYGNVACPNCPSLHFPLAAPPRYALVDKGYQTAAGFVMADRAPGDDPRTRVSEVEAGSPAAEAGLRKDDVIVKVDGLENRRIIEVEGSPQALQALGMRGEATVLQSDENGTARIVQYAYDDLPDFQRDLTRARQAPVVVRGVYDTLWYHLVHAWPRGKNDLSLTAQRGTEELPLPAFAPQTIGLHPTQLYEAISMLLLFLLLNAWFPFRRHYGEVFVLLTILYSLHRFINESLRNDTDPVLRNLTLSQVGSIVFLAVGIGMLIWLRRRPADEALVAAA